MTLLPSDDALTCKPSTDAHGRADPAGLVDVTMVQSSRRNCIKQRGRHRSLSWCVIHARASCSRRFQSGACRNQPPAPAQSTGAGGPGFPRGGRAVAAVALRARAPVRVASYLCATMNLVLSLSLREPWGLRTEVPSVVAEFKAAHMYCP